MPDDPTFEPGSFVHCWDRWHGEAVVGRVISLRGSEYHVAWVSPTNGLFEMCFCGADLQAVAAPEAVPAVEPPAEPPPMPPAEPAAPTPESVLPPAPHAAHAAKTTRRRRAE
jgi:hypothetical protein